MTETKYKLLELSTNGWNLIDVKSQNLTKEECDVWIERALANGVAQDRLKVVNTNDNRYSDKLTS